MVFGHLLPHLSSQFFPKRGVAMAEAAMEAARARENFMVIEVLWSVGCLEEVGLIVLLTECAVVMNETDG